MGAGVFIKGGTGGTGEFSALGARNAVFFLIRGNKLPTVGAFIAAIFECGCVFIAVSGATAGDFAAGSAMFGIASSGESGADRTV